LILGSFPSAASLSAGQYYAHPRNQLWRLVAAAAGLPSDTLATAPYPARVAWLRAHDVGLWDVYARCLREGSLDSAIRDAVPNDLAALVATCPNLALIAHNGGESWRHARLTGTLGPRVVRLPSSSPAAASKTFDQKLIAWREAFALAGITTPTPT
jgi:hypoxanthine-DNA glycosylase